MVVVVSALLCVRVPGPTDPVLLAAALVRAISTAARPMTVELCPVPELSRAVWGGSRMLTWALALSAAPLLSHPRAARPGDTPVPATGTAAEQLRTELAQVRREAAEERAALRQEAREQLDAVLTRFSTTSVSEQAETSTSLARRGRGKTTE